MKVGFKYPKNVDELDDLPDLFQIYCWTGSGLTDKSETFVDFLTISRKFGITFVYIFHTIYPTRKN